MRITTTVTMQELHRQWIDANLEYRALDARIDKIRAEHRIFSEPHLSVIRGSLDGSCHDARMTLKTPAQIDAACDEEIARRRRVDEAPMHPLTVELNEVLDRHRASRGERPYRESLPDVECVRAEWKSELERAMARWRRDQERYGLGAMEAQRDELWRECTRIAKAIVAATPATVEDVAMLFDVAMERDEGIDPWAQELEKRPELVAVLRALRRLAPAVEFFSLREMDLTCIEERSAGRKARGELAGAGSPRT